MPRASKFNAANFLKRAQQYTALAQRADCSFEVRRAFARKAVKCLERYDAAERRSAAREPDVGDTETANKTVRFH
jgi:hypothetical protein